MAAFKFEPRKFSTVAQESCSGSVIACVHGNSGGADGVSDQYLVLYTDGACNPNPGSGGWAFMLENRQTGEETVRSGGENDTTNNRMELMAVIAGLSSLHEPTCVEIVSDSAYVRNGLSKWMHKWKRHNWYTNGKPCKNSDLWTQLDKLSQSHKLKFTKVKGHSGHRQNEICDQLAEEESQNRLNLRRF